LKDRLSQEWSEFSVTKTSKSRPLFSKKNKSSNNKTRKNLDSKE